MDQSKVARELIELAENDGHEIDLTHLDLLDYMGILGVSFANGSAASLAYLDEIQREGPPAPKS